MNALTTLVYGIGNPGREDDGLGYEFIAKLDASDFDQEKNIVLRHNYQLNIEDADEFAQYDRIVIVDAAKKLSAGYELNRVAAVAESSFTTHALSIPAVLTLTDQLFQKKPITLLLAIKGESFDLKCGLTKSAQGNLSDAYNWFQQNFSLLPSGSENLRYKEG